MFVKVFLVCAFAAVSLCIEYPPGVDPSMCPNYPYCDMEMLTRHTPQGMPIPDWELPYARMVAAPIPDLELPYARMVAAPIPDLELPYARMVAAPIAAPIAEPIETKVSAIEYPADVDPASCPNYPYCS